ncbi:maleylacetoacetate isomerase [Novosphingobium guangzhouense]|uniref:Maleylacetoacetate isomerase n=1 Tax=Novosphingobium guangzhouense TaxID=1850347 RepID=A0A2K2G4K7_9SPHN|nr:maleylacetoacetate isomerase [Novosphingobium guangzhouense]PNU05980.1 maleylacetoacetate isomerase [Novosphingobium guangzhouense]
MRLYGYWRSSTSYRVRIALNLKRLDYENLPVNLLAGEQRGEGYRALNPFAGVPVLQADGVTRAQSMAILEWLDERFPERPLLPEGIEQRFVARELAMAIATELHAPLNLSVLQYLKHDLGHTQAEVDLWYWRWLEKTLTGVEARLAQRRSGTGAGDFLFDAPGYFECVALPQLYNARRFAFDLSGYPHLTRIEAACLELPEFAAAHPDSQPEAAR